MTNVDKIHDVIDNLSRAGRFKVIDGMLNVFLLRIGKRSTDEVLAMLVATLPCKSKLKNRDRFLEVAREVLVMIRGESENIMSGL